MSSRIALLTFALLLLLCAPAWAGTVSGLVVGQDGPLPGVAVQALESGDSTTTDASGRFRLSLGASGTVTLKFSKQGYKSLTRKIDEAATDVIVSMKRTG